MSDQVAGGERPSRLGLGGLVFGGGVIDRLPPVAGWQASIWLLIARLYLAQPFFAAGLTRLDDYRSGNWDTQLFLFAYEHPVPQFSADTAATLTMAGEVALPILTVIGLFGRWSALGLAVMAATILFLLPAPYSNLAEQLPWLIVGAMLFLTGPGFLSIDALFNRLFSRS